ncbi:MFS transporter [Nocardia huaxiensis]|uniref:MFS transporter n=1 Tax=Nocardia huaxiensis TaxID=2755382 RepID=A0A7D6ZGG4_9NOCA|nr:MFS transporter [Nocardia huaxiensis]QLY29747.1 MFS transporter [Nocardia huaxiensis]UFS96667.1 MFS transporter [Nocardia huaxiensis]
MNFRLIPLALGTFAIGVDAFVTAGLVGPVADDLHVSTSAAGQLVTVFAVSYALCSPVLAALTARFSRKQVLVSALTLFILGNVVTALAGSFALVLASRVLAAAGAALYTPNAAAVGGAITPPQRRGRAIAVVTGGLTMASAIGVPLGSWIGGALSWRATLWMVAALGLVALATVARTVPDVRLPAPSSLRERLIPLRDTTIAATLAQALMLFGGMFVVYTYLASIMDVATGGDTGRFAILLWVYGVVAVIGSTVGGRLVDRVGSRRLQPYMLAAVIVVLAVVGAASHSFATALIWAVAFGIPGWIWSVAQLHRLMELSPQSTPLLLGLNASAQYFGIALGGAVGGIGLQQWGSGSLGPIAAGLAAMALGLLLVSHRTRRSATSAVASPVAEKAAAEA